MRSAWCALLLIACMAVKAQYPLVRTHAAQDGQQGLATTCIAQDAQGLLWLGSDRGLFRTDGERTDVMLRTEGALVTAVCAGAGHVYAALSTGPIVRCDGARCDTLWSDTLFVHHPVRALTIDGKGGVWAGTYGAGEQVWRDGRITRVDAPHGLTDDHVNAQCALGNDRMAVATDQGIAIIDLDGKVLARFGEEQGAPDNLALAICADSKGGLWAGTDRGGVFSFDPERIQLGAQRVDTNWTHGPVTALAITPGRLWIGTHGHGALVCDITIGLAYYRALTAEQGEGTTVSSFLRDHDGAVWWCDGTELIRRADPQVLIIPAHEGVDMRHITALARGRGDRITFATRAGVFTHAANFSEEQLFVRYTLPIDSTTQVVALHTDAHGELWAGTFGKGVFRIAADGTARHFTVSDGFINDNVMAIRSRGEEVWFATLGGVCRWTYGNAAGSGHFTKVPIPGSGFTYDVLPLPDGTTLVATDGNSVVRIATDGTVAELRADHLPHGTFYSLCADSSGQAWACGPATGACRVDERALVPLRRDHAAAVNDEFACVTIHNTLLVMGRNGLTAIGANSGDVTDLTHEYDLQGAQAELNAACTDGKGEVWLATDKGLYRLAPSQRVLTDAVATVITSLAQGGEDLPPEHVLELAPDRDFLTIRFAGLHYAAPEDLRFAYRLIGADTLVRFTRDREVAWTNLAPGDYRFEVAAMAGSAQPTFPWTAYAFSVAFPWWRTPWAFLGGILLIAAIVIIVMRSRDARSRMRDRMEKEKARAQMQVLRSQVNPHFLFNSFNTLIELIEADTGKAVTHVEQLSDFFREILQVRDKETIPLREELSLVDTYFALEQQRFGDRIALHRRVDADAFASMLPPLTVQLLVENALKHNRASAEEPLTITLVATVEAVTVSNPFRPRDEMPKSTGFGIESIRQRSAALSNDPVQVMNDGVTFSVRVPLIHPAP